jgi:hypothetical protein
MAVVEVTGIAGTGREAMDGLMKDWYGSLWEDHVNSNAKCLAATGLGKVRGKMGGRRVLSAFIDKYPQSAGIAHFENSNLTEPSSMSAFQPELISRSLYVRLRWTGEVEDMARAGDKAVFSGPRATELRLARKQYAVNKCRMAILGPRHVLGHVDTNVGTGGTAGDTITLTMHSRNDRDSQAGNFYKFGSHYLKKGMLIDFGDSADADSEGASGVDGGAEKFEVTSVSGNSVVVTQGVTGAQAPAAGELLWPWGSRRAGGKAAEDASSADIDSYFAGYNGLNNLMLDSTVYGAVYGTRRGSDRPTLDGNRQTGGGTDRHFSDLLLILGIDQIVEEGSGEEPDTLYLNSAVRREVVQHLGMGNEHGGGVMTGSQARRFAPVQTTSGYGKLAIVAGDRSMSYDTDRDCPPGMIYILRKGTMGYLSNRTLSSVDKTPERYVTNKDAHEIVMAERGNFFCTSPWTNGTLEDIDFLVDGLTVASITP